MAKAPTEKSPHESKYSEGYVTFAQWMVERICERKAAAERRGRLPPRFWKEPLWAPHFRQQMTALRAVLKSLELEGVDSTVANRAVEATFGHREMLWVLSFRTPKFMAAARAVAKSLAASKSAGPAGSASPTPAADNARPTEAPIATSAGRPTSRSKFALLDD